MLYPLESTQEELTDDQLLHFNIALEALKSRLQLKGLNPSLLELHFDGTTQPKPFPDLHWEIVTCWMLVDGTVPPPISINQQYNIDYQQTLLRDQTTLHRWREKLRYAETGFRYK